MVEWDEERVSAFVYHCFTFFWMPVGAFTNGLAMRFTSRAVVFTGGLFLSLGFITSMFATRLSHLFFTYGFLLGNIPPFAKNQIQFVQDAQNI